jgi:MOSC domain-containing protein YiiM
MIASGAISAVHIGKVTKLSADGRRTAFRKLPVAGAIAVHSLGLAGDQQGNLRVHGGTEKAVYGYPISGYAGWQAEFPAMADRFVAGAMGENLVIAGLDEEHVHIGDIVRAGTALLQIAQIREPCSTFAAVLGTTKVVRAMTKSGRCGWYYRVLEPGQVAAGDDHAIIERPNPHWSIARFARFAAGQAGTTEALHELTSLPGLTPAWQRKAAAALARQALAT